MLRNEDFYGLVMMEQAWLPVRGRSVGSSGADLVDLARAFLTDACIAVPGLVLCFDPFGWKIVESDSARAGVFVLCGVALWFVSMRKRQL